MTEGERRIYTYISESMEKLGTKYRGAHTLRIHYDCVWPVCDCCKQAVRINSDEAYNMFLRATLIWNGKEVTHEELRYILLGISDDVIDSHGVFRNPESYGIDPFREWGRRVLGKSIVLADLDISVRRYGSRFDLDSHGDLMLIEKKETWGN